MCRFYGWTVEYCLKMPAVTFFAMLNASIKLDALEKIALCDIQAISIANNKYYTFIRDTYKMRVKEPELPQVPEISLEASMGLPVYEANSVEAKNALTKLMASAKRSGNYKTTLQ